MTPDAFVSGDRIYVLSNPHEYANSRQDLRFDLHGNRGRAICAPFQPPVDSAYGNESEWLFDHRFNAGGYGFRTLLLISRAQKVVAVLQP